MCKSKPKKQQSRYPIWFTRNIIAMINAKHKHWNIYRNTKSIFHLDKLKELRRDIRREARLEYIRFVRKSENSLNQDPKKFWSFVNQKRKHTSIPGSMTYNDNTLTSQQDIVNAFAAHFANTFNFDSNHHVCDNLCCDNHKVSCDLCNKICCPSLNFNENCDNRTNLSRFSIEDGDILKAVSKMKPNNVCGSDNIPAFLIVDCINCLLLPLRHIFNLILKSCLFPKIWKISHVVPIFKAGDKTNIENYRPIALLRNVAKLFECILSEAIYSHVIS